jgi:galactonate dehydratase
MTRRAILSLFAAPLISRAAASAVIDKIELFQVRVNRRGNWLIARLTTTNGITGLGDASHGRDNQVMSLLKTFFDRLKGRPAFDVEPLRYALWPEVRKAGRDGAVAFGGLEQAMWDIQGKSLGLPVWALFGGKIHSKLRNYANINRSTDVRNPEGFAALARRAVAAGFDAIKMASFDGMPRQGSLQQIEEHTRLGIDCIKAVRDAIGPSRDLLVDAHSNFNLERGLDLAIRLQPLNLFWLEEVSPGIENLARINQAAKMPTAGGESLFGVHGFHPYISGKAVDIIMPDIKYCGGLLETKKIAAMGEAADMACSPHGPASPIGNIAAAHLCATLPNFQILELGFGEVPWRHELINPPESFEKGGLLTVPDKPGFGITLNERTVRQYAV